MTVRPFTPQRESAEVLSARTVGREEILEALHTRLLSAATSGAKPHTLLVGPRGAGKSHVIEVVLHRAAQDAAFAANTVVVRIPEDSTAITRFADLHTEILKVLGEPIPAPDERAERITEALGDRTIVLVIENLDRVFQDIGLEGQRNLRAWVETSRKVMLLTTTPAIFGAVTQRDQPWFGGLATIALPALTPDEGQQLVALLADTRGDEDLAEFVRSKTGTERMRAVAALAGGSPRIWMILGAVATKESLDELVPAVEDMLEGLVPYYQQLLWSLSPNERRIITALARASMLTVAQLAEATEIDPKTTATTLRRLAEARWVSSEKPPEGDRRVTYYRLREPLLRFHLQHREEGREPLALIVELLKAFFTPRERAGQFLDGAGSVGAEYLLASLSATASDNALVVQPASEFPFIAVDWTRSTLPEVRQAGRDLCRAWKQVPRPATAEGLLDAMTPDVEDGGLILRLVDCVLRGADRETLRELWDESVAQRNSVAATLIAENVAAVLGERREFEDALRFLEHAEQTLAEDGHDPGALRLRGERAFWTGQAGDFGQAHQIFEQLLPACLEILGPGHPDTLTTRANIAYYTGETGHPDTALTLYTDLLPDRTRILGPDHPGTLTTRAQIAYCTVRTGHPDTALTLYTDLLPDVIRVLGPDHPDTLTTRAQIAYCTERTGHPDTALTLFTDLLPDLIRVLGPDDARTKAAISAATHLTPTLSGLQTLIPYVWRHNEPGIGELVLAAWRIGKTAAPSEFEPADDPFPRLLTNIGRAAAGDSAARAALPPGMLEALEEADAIRADIPR